MIRVSPPLLEAVANQKREEILRLEKLCVITSYSIHYTKLYEAGAKFRVELVSRAPEAESLSANGFDEAELLFCANPGQEMRPLSLTASGGELSRVMLALRNASERGRGNRTMVFDEIDT